VGEHHQTTSDTHRPLPLGGCLRAVTSGPHHEEGEAGAGFGNTFAGNERYIVAGVGAGDARAKDAGYALIYERRRSGWHLVDGLVDMDGREGDRFGWRVAMAGSTALDPDEDGWVCRQIIQPDGRWNRGEFGYSIAVSEQTLLVGSPKSSAQNKHSGSAYVFTRDDEGMWIQQ
jgi:hypothetical protein